MHRARQAHTARRARRGLPPSGGQAERLRGVAMPRNSVWQESSSRGIASLRGIRQNRDRNAHWSEGCATCAISRLPAGYDRGRGLENRNEPGNPAWRIDARSGSFGRGSPWRGLHPRHRAVGGTDRATPLRIRACPDAAAPKSAPDVAGPGPGHWTAREPVSRPGHPCGQVARYGRAYSSRAIARTGSPVVAAQCTAARVPGQPGHPPKRRGPESGTGGVDAGKRVAWVPTLNLGGTYTRHDGAFRRPKEPSSRRIAIRSFSAAGHHSHCNSARHSSPTAGSARDGCHRGWSPCGSATKPARGRECLFRRTARSAADWHGSTRRSNISLRSRLSLCDRARRDCCRWSKIRRSWPQGSLAVGSGPRRSRGPAPARRTPRRPAGLRFSAGGIGPTAAFGPTHATLARRGFPHAHAYPRWANGSKNRWKVW